MGNRKLQTDHDKMVKDAAKWLKESKYINIKADVQGYSSPEKITWTNTGKGHIPDLSADKTNGTQLIFEVETEDSINIQHTADQWELFSENAKQQSKEFWVIVPKSSVQDAVDRLSELNLIGQVWGI